MWRRKNFPSTIFITKNGGKSVTPHFANLFSYYAFILGKKPQTHGGEKSRIKLKQKQKFWAKPDKIVQAEVDGVVPEPDKFKATHVLSASHSKLSTNLPERPALVQKQPFKGKAKSRPGTHKWSMMEAYHRGDPKNRFTTKPATMLTTDLEPLYSSFNKTAFQTTLVKTAKVRQTPKKVPEPEQRSGAGFVWTTLMKGVRTGSFSPSARK